MMCKETCWLFFLVASQILVAAVMAKPRGTAINNNSITVNDSNWKVDVHKSQSTSSSDATVSTLSTDTNNQASPPASSPTAPPAPSPTTLPATSPTTLPAASPTTPPPALPAAPPTAPAAFPPTPPATTPPATPPTSAPTSPPCAMDSAESVDNPASFYAGLLLLHNKYRTAAGLRALLWSPELSLYGMNYILNQDRYHGCKFEHSPQNQRAKIGNFSNCGENLYMSMGFVPSPQRVVGSWYNETFCYKYGNIGDPCTLHRTPRCTLNPIMTGHFTQLMWESTTHVGCARLSCNSCKNVGYCPAVYVSCVYGSQRAGYGGNLVGIAPFSNTVARRLGLDLCPNSKELPLSLPSHPFTTAEANISLFNETETEQKAEVERPHAFVMPPLGEGLEIMSSYVWEPEPPATSPADYSSPHSFDIAAFDDQRQFFSSNKHNVSCINHTSSIDSCHSQSVHTASSANNATGKHRLRTAPHYDHGVYATQDVGLYDQEHVTTTDTDIHTSAFNKLREINTEKQHQDGDDSEEVEDDAHEEEEEELEKEKKEERQKKQKKKENKQKLTERRV